MWRHLALFEIRYWFRSWSLWIFLAIIAGISLWVCSSSDNVIGSVNCDWNAGYVVEQYYSIFCIFTLLMATVFVNSSATRDFATHSDQIIFALPISKREYLAGRFVGATLVSAIPILGVSIGILLAPYSWWTHGDFQRINWAAHALGIAIWAIPNTLFIAAILFAVAVATRSSAASFVSGICVIVGYSVSQSYLSDLKSEWIGALFDPFGAATFRYATRYWTSADKDRLLVGFHGLIVWNRLLWMAVALAIFVYAYRRFSFAPRRTGAPVEEEPVTAIATLALPQAAFAPPRPGAQFRQLLRLELRAIAKTASFVVMLLGALAIMLWSLISKATEGYGNSAFPVTYKVVELLQAGLALFDISVVLYFAGVVVWREIDSGTDEIMDAQPVSEWLVYLAKLCAVLVPLTLFKFAGILTGMAVQAAHGYFRFQPGVYAVQVLGLDLSGTVCLAVLAIFFHVVSARKYVAWFAFPLFLLLDAYIWKLLNVATLLVKFAEIPTVTYSDFFGWQPYRATLFWFELYWLAFSVLLAMLTVLVWRRGPETRWRHRWANLRLRLHGPLRRVAIGAVCIYAAILAVIVYNTMILHHLVTDRDIAAVNARYEQSYKQYEHTPQPRITSAKYRIELYPEDGHMTIHCDAVIENHTAQPIPRLFIDYAAHEPHTVSIPGTHLAASDPDTGFESYLFTPPLQPGESRPMTLETSRRRRGFENGPGELTVVPNGIFINNRMLPRIGYHRDDEVDDDRARYSLGSRVDLPEPSRNCTADCAHNYLEPTSDWVDVETVIGTSADQIAIAPGSLVREWRTAGRRYFEYRIDHPSLNFYSFLSARYEVAREEWNGIKIEVYYLREHPWNVARMKESIRKSLDYYTRNFGPYAHKEARIIEFPRLQSFAQSYPSTMPYAESVGFIANLEDPDAIDHVFYVVAHEMAHQWWGHQVAGAPLQGATLLSESLAQYSALMVMEKEYGREMIRKFLRYETDQYLKGRANTKRKEQPLLTVRDEQMYVRYNKASSVFYQMREMIGEEAMNRALRKVLARYRYAEAPYPTSYALVDALREETPPEMRYLIADLFENITLVSTSVTGARAHRRLDDKYDVSMDVEFRKSHVNSNGDEVFLSPPADYVEIGAFAAPAHGKYGRLLHLEQVFIQHESETFHFTLDQRPASVAIDPLALTIDKDPDRHTRSIEIQP